MPLGALSPESMRARVWGARSSFMLGTSINKGAEADTGHRGALELPPLAPRVASEPPSLGPPAPLLAQKEPRCAGPQLSRAQQGLWEAVPELGCLCRPSSCSTTLRAAHVHPAQGGAAVRAY